MQTARGFTLIELLVVIAIIAILAALLFPVFVRAKHRAHLTQCISNLRQLVVALRLYADDSDATYPLMALVDGAGNHTRWVNGLGEYARSDELFACPYNRVYTDAASRPEPRAPWPETSYYYCAYALGGSRDLEIRRPSNTIILMDGWFFEGEGGPQGRNYPMYFSPWATPQVLADWCNALPTTYVDAGQLERMHSHNGGLVVTFVDAHAKWVTTAQPEQFTLSGQ